MMILFTQFALAKVVINEIMPENDGILLDEDGEYSDWIELFNEGSSAVDLEGFYLSDNEADIRKWQFPAVVLNPGEFLIVFTSGKNRNGAELHTNFSLSSAGEPIILSEDDGRLEDYIGPQPLWKNISFGRQSDGDNDFLLFEESTPGASNSAIGAYQSQFPIVINEVMASNETSITDEDGDNSDWIEFYNTSGSPFNLEGFVLTDDNDEIYKWTFPSIEVPAGGHLLVFASGKDKTDNELHTNFSLRSDGENITLSNQLGIRVDKLPARALVADHSFGRAEDGSPEWQLFSQSSPNDENDESIPLYPLLFSQPAGIYSSDMELGIYCPKNADIHYTLDSSDPRTNDDEFDDMIELSSREGDPNEYSEIPSTTEFEPPVGEVYKINTVRAQAFIDGDPVSPIVTRSYIVEPDDERFNLPILSIVSDPDNFFDDDIGIYVPGSNYNGENESSMNCFQSGPAWERPIHLEFFEDGEATISQDAGIRIHGGGSRREPQKALRLYARSDYGPKNFSNQFFPEKDIKEFRRLVLRGKPQSNRSCLTDEIGAKLSAEMDLEHMALRQTLLFINGEFWGVYGIRERIDEHYIKSNFGHEEEDITILNGNPENGGCCVVGNSVEYNEMITFIEDNDATDDAIYSQIEDMIDIDNLIDYHLLQMWAANYDWPRNNIRYWKPVGGKWRWIVFDLDFCMRFWDRPTIYNFFNIASSNTNEWSTFLLRTLIENDDFKERFIQRLELHLNNTLTPQTVACYANQLRHQMAPHMQEYSDRFDYGWSEESWQGYVDDVIQEFASERPCFLEEQIDDEFNESLDIPDCTPFLTQEGYELIDTVVALCEGDEVEFGGITYSEEGKYIDTLDLGGACGTILLLDVDIKNAENVELTASICEGESYQLGNSSYDASGFYSENFSTGSGCDSTVYLQLEVKSEFLEEVEAEICTGQSFVFGSIEIDEEDFYEFTFTTAEGCDSTYEINLSVGSGFQTEIEASICAGEVYEIGDEEFENSGVYTLNYETTGGCDSIVQLELTVNNLAVEKLDISICEGSEFIVGNESFENSGDYNIQLQTTAGCDSLVELNLEVIDEFEEEIEAFICEGSSFEFGGEDLDESGVYNETFQSSAGCDSTVELTLEVFAEMTTEMFEQICEGESFELEGEDFDESGNYEVVVNNGGDCNTTILLELLVSPVYETSFVEEICEGESFTIGDNDYDSSGNYLINLSTVSGCDSIIELNLQVGEIYDEEEFVSICQGESYTFGNIDLNLEGTYSLDFESALGCDSSVTLNLEIEPNIEQEIQAEICAGGTYFYEGAEFDDEGEYEFEYSSVNGCDSLVVLVLNVSDEIENEAFASVCEGSTYQFGDEELDEAGTYSESFVTSTGCDSTVVLTLMIDDEIESETSVNICEGGSYEFGGEELNDSGTYSENYTTSAGCDSTATLFLTVNEEIENEIEASICEGQFFQFGDEELDESGTYTESFTSTTGCDSTVILLLLITDEIENEFDFTICEGESFVFGDDELDESGSYIETFNATSGCDSTVQLTLEVIDGYDEEVEVSICDNSSYNFNGEELTEAGEYEANFTSTGGCDSLVTLTLVTGDVSTTNLTETICEGETYEFMGDELESSGSYLQEFESSTGCDSLVLLDLTVEEAIESEYDAQICEGGEVEIAGEVYTEEGEFELNYNSVNGCDSTVLVSIEFSNEIEVDNPVNICIGESYQINGNSYTGAGDYFDTFTAMGGCDSTVRTILSVGFPVLVVDSISICFGDELLIEGETITSSGDYEFQLVSQEGCDSIYRLALTVNDGPSDIYQFDQSSSTLQVIDGEDSYQWFFEGDLMDGEEAANLQLTNEGNYSVVIGSENGCSTTVEYYFQGTGITEAFSQVQLYPNPVDDWLNIDRLPDSGVTSIAIYHANGKLVEEIQTDTQTEQLDLSHLSMGVYLIEITNAENRLVQRILKN